MEVVGQTQKELFNHDARVATLAILDEIGGYVVALREDHDRRVLHIVYRHIGVRIHLVLLRVLAFGARGRIGLDRGFVGLGDESRLTRPEVDLAIFCLFLLVLFHCYA